MFLSGIAAGLGAWIAWVILLLLSLHRKVNRLMSTEQDLQTTLDVIKDGVGRVATQLRAMADTITALQAQVAAGTPVSQTQLDALTAEATDIAQTLNTIAPPPAVAAPAATTPTKPADSTAPAPADSVAAPVPADSGSATPAPDPNAVRGGLAPHEI